MAQLNAFPACRLIPLGAADGDGFDSCPIQQLQMEVGTKLSCFDAKEVDWKEVEFRLQTALGFAFACARFLAPRRYFCLFIIVLVIIGLQSNSRASNSNLDVGADASFNQASFKRFPLHQFAAVQ